jgi:hypothetical protein
MTRASVAKKFINFGDDTLKILFCLVFLDAPLDPRTIILGLCLAFFAYAIGGILSEGGNK